ncbi:MAG: NADH:flavin oxidoreductase/NADH oxidase [Longispora sp.]|nr:NADH:flavin oxidoreductase/NADH oxidase [Longispora sp. (in: high G+C Gram-positive bacteria)]
MSQLFEPITLRALTMPNRVWVSPMCQYSSMDGLPNDWHLVHLGQFVAGGAGLIFTEATAIVPEGRISPQDTGIWSEDHTRAWRGVTDFVHDNGGLIGMQLAHAGRKGSTYRPWEGHGSVPASDGGWQAVGPSGSSFGDYAAPRALSTQEVAELPGRFAEAARRAISAGFDTVELHFAHGYLVHQFLSPLSNERDDQYGGDFSGRTRLALDIADAVRVEVGDDLPVITRISATDWVEEGGWDIDQSVRLSALLADRGVDLIDVSSGGNVHGVRIPTGPGYQVPFATRIRVEAGMPTGAVGMITEPDQAEKIIGNGQADVVLLARELLREPHWPLRAAHALGAQVSWVNQYLRARYRD